jgi:hypothetical protein
MPRRVRGGEVARGERTVVVEGQVEADGIGVSGRRLDRGQDRLRRYRRAPQHISMRAQGLTAVAVDGRLRLAHRKESRRGRGGRRGELRSRAA